MSDLSTEMIRQTSIGIQHRKVSSANITNTQLLVSRGSGGIRELLQFSLASREIRGNNPSVFPGNARVMFGKIDEPPFLASRL